MENSTPKYELDEETQSLIEVALNCLVQLSEAQIEQEAGENLILIANEIAERFGITRIDVLEEQHDGETILKPKGGIFGDEDDNEDN